MLSEYDSSFVTLEERLARVGAEGWILELDDMTTQLTLHRIEGLVSFIEQRDASSFTALRPYFGNRTLDAPWIGDSGRDSWEHSLLEPSNTGSREALAPPLAIR